MTRFRLAAIDENREVRNNEGHLHVYLDGVELAPPVAKEVRFRTTKQ